MKVQHVPLEWVPRVWPLVKDHIATAMEHSKGDYTVDHIQAYVASGQWLLLVAAEGETIHGAATVELFNRPNSRVAFITAIGGKLISSQETFAQLKALLASFGATTIEGAARESIARLWSRYGFEEKYRIVEFKL
jgi:hypothetical protein